VIIATVGAMMMALAACGGLQPTPPVLPSQGGPPWRELQSEHFTLWTNATSERGRELVQQMELRRQVLVRGMNRAPANGRILAIGLRSTSEALEFLPLGKAAVAWPSGYPFFQAGILFSAEHHGELDAVVLNHELAHAISDSIIVNQPKWFAEGLACYFEMATRDERTGVVQIGLPHPTRLRAVLEYTHTPIAKLLACSSMECTNEKFYATSWALFSYLLTYRYEQFARYQQRLNQLEERPLEAAPYLEIWRQEFPDLSLDELGMELRAQVKTFKPPRFTMDVQQAAVSERPLVEADVLATHSLLYMIRHPEKSQAAMKAAIALEPHHPLAWMVSALWGHPMSQELARAIAAAHPGQWRAWLLVERFAKDEQERGAAFRRLCELAAKDGSPCRSARKTP
jgi:Protein of unknown function (DUF1570)